MDLKCIKPAPGGSYYKDHLPMLGEKSELMTMPTQSTSSMRAAAAVPNFPMEGSGATPTAGTMVAGSIASLEMLPSSNAGNKENATSLDSNSSIDGNITMGHAASVTSQNVCKQFQMNDRVRICATRETCISLQTSHGGWNSKMDNVRK